MIPPRGWRDRQARARARYGRNVTSDPVVAAERARIYAEREAALAALEAAEKPAAPGPVTAATMLANALPVIDDVTPDDDEAPAEETAEDAAGEATEEPADEPAEESAAEEPQPAPPQPAKPATRAKKKA